MKLFRSRPLWFLVVFKAVYMLLVIGAVLLWPTDRDADIFHSKRQAWTAEGHLTFESHFTTWDTEHYLHLCEVGYEAGSPACAFYPLWPMAVRWFSPLVGGSHVIGGMVLANIVSLVGFCLFFRMVERRLGGPVAWLALVFLLAFPGSLFYQFNYTEALFLMLLMLLCLGLEEGRFRLAIVAGFLLPLTRAVGVLCVAPILLHIIIHNFDAFPLWLTKRAQKAERFLRWLRGGQSGVVKASGGTNHPAPFWLVAAPICGWMTYLVLMWSWTGNPFEGFRAQQHWGVQSVGNLFDIPKFVIGLFVPTAWHEFVGSTLDRCVFCFCLYMLLVVWRLDRTWFLWTVVLAIVPAVSGTFCSFTRFAAVAFPVFVALAVFLARPERRVLRYLALGVFCALHVALLWRFVNYRWAG